MSEEKNDSPIVFKKRKQRANIRSKIEDLEIEGDEKNGGDDAEESNANWSVIDEFRELKRAKKAVVGKGINVMDLLVDPNQKQKQDDESKERRAGGLQSIGKLESELDLGQTFSAETNKRDEDGEMNLYINEMMAKRTNRPTDSSTGGSSSSKSTSSATAASFDQTHDMFLKVIPEKLLNLARKQQQEEKKEEMLSSQMLTSIPEVDLGVDERIKNIEKTEAARAKYFQERAKQRREDEKESADGLGSLAPKNVASCFKKEPNIRFDAAYIERHSAHDPEQVPKLSKAVSKKNQKIQYDFEPVVQIGAEPATMVVQRIERSKMPGKNTPSDDFVFEKFKKNMHRR